MWYIELIQACSSSSSGPNTHTHHHHHLTQSYVGIHSTSPHSTSPHPFSPHPMLPTQILHSYIHSVPHPILCWCTLADPILPHPILLTSPYHSSPPSYTARLQLVCLHWLRSRSLSLDYLTMRKPVCFRASARPPLYRTSRCDSACVPVHVYLPATQDVV